MKAIKFLVFSFAAVLVIVYSLYVSYIYFNQAEMVFKNHKLADNYVFSFSNPFQEVRIASKDGTLQHGLLFTTNRPKGIIFYLHGNAGAIDSWGAISSIYTQMGYDFFIIDYRGFGKSQGKIDNEAQVLQDVVTVFDKVTKNYSKKIIVGYSIGTGIAASLAASRANEGLVLKAPFYNFLDYSDIRAPYFPDFLKKFSFETDKNLNKVHTPIYIFHGKEDLLIPIENSYRLQQKFKSKVTLFVLENQDHLGMNTNPKFQKTMAQILR